jgi:hypothetical protein
MVSRNNDQADIVTALIPSNDSQHFHSTRHLGAAWLGLGWMIRAHQ